METGGPAFSAYGSATQSFANATWTKISYNTKEFDTDTAYDATTNYRFQPVVSGYYQLQAVMTTGTPAANCPILISIYKNGTLVKYGNYGFATTTNGGLTNVTALIYLNGSTDYVEAWGYQNSGGALNCGSANAIVSFSGYLAKAA